MKKIINPRVGHGLIGFVALSLSSLAAQAEGMQFKDMQLSLLVGYSQVDVSRNELNRRLDSGRVSQLDKSSTSWSAELTLPINTDWVASLGYADLGEGSAHITGESVDASAYQQAVAEVSPILPQGFLAGMRYRVVEHDLWDMQAEAGIWRWRSDISSDVANYHLSTKVNSTDWYAGLQSRYQLGNNWSAVARLRYYNLSDAISDFSVGLTYRF